MRILNNKNGFFAIFSILLFCVTGLYLCVNVSAEDYEEITEGVYQETIPSYDIDEGPEEEYSMSDEEIEEEYQREFGDNSNDEESNTSSSYSEEGTSEENTENSEEIDLEENETNTVSDEEIINILTLIDQDLRKLIISLWSLFGFLLGTKLMKGLFGYDY